MAKVDLHVHTKYSEHPTEWFLKRIGANESYTDPETVYRLAKERGMDFVTITDHNRIDGAVKICEKHPQDTFVGVESTVYFPEDRCKVHILLFGITPSEFVEVEKYRKDIYQFRDYLNERKIAHSVAHVTYAVNGNLTLQHLEKLTLLFNVFEAKNGGRNRLNNQSWETVLNNLTSDDILRLYQKYHIEPTGETPWVKGYTGGSDDHAGLFIGKTFTESNAVNVNQFLETLRNRQSIANGRHSDYQSLVYSIYKIAYEFSMSNGGFSKPIFQQLNQAIFENRSVPFSSVWKLNWKLFLSKISNPTRKESSWLRHTKSLVQCAQSQDAVTDKLNRIVDTIGSIGDELMKDLFTSVEDDLQKGDLERLLSRVVGTLPGVFLSVPFITSYNHMHRSRTLIDELNIAFNVEKQPKRVLWFTDTLTHLNGVAMTLQAVGNKAIKTGKTIRIATSLTAEELDSGNYPYVINIPSVHEFSLPYYSSYAMRVPSIMKALAIIDEYDPEEIYISTPGPIGLLGVLIGKLSKIPITGIYHTDFTMQLNDIIGDDSLHNTSELYTRWFYSLCDKIQVPTTEYMDILSERGLPRSKMKLFRRGIDCEVFKPDQNAYAQVGLDLKLNSGIRLLYAGRVSRDKNLTFLLEIYRELSRKYPTLNLIIAGDGPFLKSYKQLCYSLPNIYFTGKVSQNELATLYAGSDLFVFPSNTDTFGMVVLEAQACGLPPVVSDIGGPQELVSDCDNGFLARADDLEDWVRVVSNAIDQKMSSPIQFSEVCDNARTNAVSDSDWENLIEDMIHPLSIDRVCR